MNEADFFQFAAKKAFEISYATFRLSSSMPDRTFADYFKTEALGLLHSATIGDLASAEKTLRAMEYMARLGVEAGVITIGNSQILLNEIKGLQTEISSGKPATREPDIRQFFSEKRHHSSKRQSTNTAINVVSNGSANEQIDTDNKANGNDRQTAIAEFIRQKGDCRLKDIQEILPDMSERTLRYDLQRMVEQGVLERVGGGGPFSFYRIRSSLDMPLENPEVQ